LVRGETMATYSTDVYARIAAAIGRDLEDVVEHKQLFEAAAVWYGLDCGLGHGAMSRLPPSKIRAKLQRIAKSARRLMKDLEITNDEDAADGPGSVELLDVLAAVEVPSEDAVVTAAERLGQLATIMDAAAAARELERRALGAAEDVIEIGKLIVPKGHQGDAPVNNWVAAMMEAYRKITGIEPATSVGHVGQLNEGIASGPFIRFLKAAGDPLGLTYSEDAWRSRVRTILKHHQN
jgi:hypothetical protein